MSDGIIIYHKGILKKKKQTVQLHFIQQRNGKAK